MIMPLAEYQFAFRPARRSRSAGFTLPELMVTVAISAILLGIGVPSFRSFILGQQVTTATADLSYNLTLARSEAIKRNGNVMLEPAETGWQGGWRVAFGDTTLAEQAAYRQGVTIAGPDNLTYNSSGRISGTTTELSFEVSDGTQTRCVSIQLSGMPSTRTGSCSS